MHMISGFTEMRYADFSDRRRNLCAARLFDRLMLQPSGSFSAAVGHDGRQAAHRLFASEEVTPKDMLSGHVAATVQRTREACASEKWLLIVQDTTDLDYSNHKKTTGLGSIGQGYSLGRGLQAHGAMAVTESGLPLGMVHLNIWSRQVAQKIY